MRLEQWKHDVATRRTVVMRARGATMAAIRAEWKRIMGLSADELRAECDARMEAKAKKTRGEG